MGDVWKEGHPKFQPYSLDQLVLYKVQRSGFLTSNKFSPHFKGPYSITKVNRNNKTYEITDCNSGEVLRAHHNQLRHYNRPPTYINNHPFIRRMNECHPDNHNPICNFSSNDSDSLADDQSSVGSSSEREPSLVNGNDNISDNETFSGFSIADPNNSHVTNFYKLTNLMDEEASSCKCCRYESVKELGGAVDAFADRTQSSLDTPLSPLHNAQLNCNISMRYDGDDWQLSPVESVNLSDNDNVDGDVYANNDGDCISRNDTRNHHSKSEGSIHVSTQVSNDIITTDVSTNTDNLSLISTCSPNLLIIDTTGSGYGSSPPPLPGCGDEAQPAHLQFAGASPQLGGAVDDSFRGFIFDKSLDRTKVVRLFEIIDKNKDSHSTVSGDSSIDKRVTRSKGTVPELPNVQPKILERKRPSVRDYSSS